MKLTTGKSRYKLPPVGQIVGVTVELPAVGAGAAVVVELVEVDLAKMAQTVALNPRVGADTPAFYTHDGDELHVWPTPHRGGRLAVRYYPPQEVA